MLNKKLMMLTIILVSLLAVSTVSAADNATSDVVGVDETTDDAISIDEADDYVSVEDNQLIEQTENEETISATDNGTFSALDNKIKTSTDSTIKLENDYKYEGEGYPDGIIIEKSDITIDGQGHKINADGKTGIFNVQANNVVIKNITFLNSYTIGEGGAIYVADSGSAVNCTFINNSALHGGAIYIICADIVNCTFVNNSAGCDGGAIYIDRGIVENSIFVNNNADMYGGAIYGSDAVNCTFINNSASIDGGAIYKPDSVVNCSFVNNSADESGGAIYEPDSVVNCSFVNNSADESGGAIYEANSVVNCSFVNNNADEHGGAINIALSVDNCNFTDNSAEKNGGAINNALSVDNCNFTGNSAYEGGAINNAEYIMDCNFTGNSAAYGGAIYSSSAFSCTFINNYAYWGGGAIGFETFDSYYDGIRSFEITDCNIQEDCLNEYDSISFVDNKLFVRSTEDNTKVKVYISEKEYIPYACQEWRKVIGDHGLTYYALIFDLSDLSAGNHEVHIYYKGFITIRTLEIIVPINIKKTISVSSNDVTKYYGGPEKYTINLTEDGNVLANKNVKITANGETSTVKTDSKGQASVDLILPVGTYDVVSEYEGVSTTSKVTVKSTVTVNDAKGTYLNSKVTATFLNADGKALASKQVTFKVGDKTYTATTNIKGVATADIDLGVGLYTVTAINPVNNEQKPFKLVIDKANSAIALSSSQSGEVTTLTATLTPTTATGNVVFNVNGEDKSTPIKNGKATLTLSDLEPGDYSVTASYSGDANLNASTSNTITFNVAEAYPILTAKAVTKTYGTTTKLTVYLKDSKGNAIANAKVNVNINNKITPITTDSNGQATMAISQAPGTYYAKITYPEAKEITAKIIVKKATPKITAKAKTFKKSVKTKKYTVTLKNNKNKALSKVKLSLKVKGKTYYATTNKYGKATFKITKLTKKGKYTATIKFKSTKYYTAKTVKPKITVK